jgi:hypothetical protein
MRRWEDNIKIVVTAKYMGIEQSVGLIWLRVGTR